MLNRALVVATLSSFLAGTALTTPTPSQIPDYVKTYAPVFYLHSSEVYNPSSIDTHLANVLPKLGGSGTAPPGSFTPTTSNLDQLNSYGTGGTNIYLTSKVKAAGTSGINQGWLKGVKPVNGKTNGVPTITIVADKGNGVVDAFWFTFYSYNRGTNVLLVNFGNHVGDWEHVMIRFQNGVPQSIWMGQHSKGQAFTYSGLEKYSGDNKRIVAYVAQNSHAIYSTTGSHDHSLNTEANRPHGPLEDQTNKGTLWDPLLTAPLYFNFDVPTKTFAVAAENPNSPTNWLDFTGHWGDQKYSQSDTPGQITIAGNSVYEDGPTGPRDKALDRTGVCPPSAECTIYTSPQVKM